LIVQSKREERERGRTDGNPFDFGVGEGDAQIIEGEHAMKGLDKEQDLHGAARKGALR
jgi:hypothetical protein